MDSAWDLLRILLWYAAVIAALGLLNSMLAALAFRINLGAAEFPLETREYVYRSALTGFALAGYTAVAAFFSLVLVARNAYALFGICMIPYPILAVYLYNWAYALDDLLEGFKIFLIHHVPLVLLLVGCIAYFKPDSFVRFVLHA